MRLIEGLEKVSLGFLGDAGAAVRDGQEYMIWRVWAGREHDAPIFWRKFMSIMDEVGDNLVKAVRISPDRQILSRPFRNQLLVFGLGQGQEFLSDFFQEGCKGHGLMGESNRAGLDTGEI